MDTSSAANKPYSARPLPVVHAETEKLYQFVQRELTRAPAPLAGRIQRGVLNAALAIASASLGSRTRYHLRRAREAMLPCLGLFRFLRIDGHVNEAVYEQARRRIDRILAGIDELELLQVEKWPQTSAPRDRETVDRDVPTTPPRNEEIAAAEGETPQAVTAPPDAENSPPSGDSRGDPDPSDGTS